MDELEPGTLVGGRYCVERLLARGGMSLLYLGHPLQGAGRVAIKQLDVPDATPEDLAQFRKEHELLHGLHHPGLARALDFIVQEGHHFLVEEFVPGETLEAHLQAQGRLPADQAVTLVDQLLRVLGHLHGHGIIYRDLKPQNVILQPRPSEDGDEDTATALPFTARLVDFGAARRWKRGAVSDTIALGTPGFASPEQYGKAQSDARSDIYGAGALLHHMLTGNAPHPSLDWTFPDPCTLVPGLPPAVGRAVLRAVQVQPGERFPDAETMRLALARAMGWPQHCDRCGTRLPGDGTACPRCSRVRTRTRRVPILVALVPVALLASILIPSFMRARACGQLTACRSNLKGIIATALEMYATDNEGHYPRTLSLLVPKYLGTIPTCPTAGYDTYSSGYTQHAHPDQWAVSCAGTNHENLGQGSNLPQYTSYGELIAQ